MGPGQSVLVHELAVRLTRAQAPGHIHTDQLAAPQRQLSSVAETPPTQLLERRARGGQTVSAQPAPLFRRDGLSVSRDRPAFRARRQSQSVGRGRTHER